MNSHPQSRNQLHRVVTRTAAVLTVGLAMVGVARAAGSPCVLTCPKDISVNAEDASCAATVNYDQPTMIGDCSGASLQCLPAPGSFNVGTTAVHCTATDATGTTVAQCSFNVTVLSANSPQISYPGNVAVCTDAGQSSAVAEFGVEAKDSCGDVPVVCVPPSGSTFQTGTTTVRCSAGRDPSSGIVISFPVVVSDCSGAPVLTCPAAISTCTDAGKCTAVVAFTPPVSPAATVLCTPAPGSEFPKGTTTVTCKATDGSGKASTCTFPVTVNDCEAPKINCPANIVTCTDAGKSTATVTYSVSATDNCGSAPVACTPPSGSAFSVGTATVSCRATDAAGNKSDCTFSVTVNTCVAPQAVCPSDMTLCADTGKCTAVVQFALADASAVCDPKSGSEFPKGVTPVNCTVTAANGTQSKCGFNVTVNECEPPKIDCPANLVKCFDPGKQSAVVNFTVQAKDACGGVLVACDPKPGTVFNQGTTTVTCAAPAPAGATVTCAFTVTVMDCSATGANCPPDITVCADPGQCTAVVNYPPAATGTGPLVCDPKSGSIFPTGTTTVTCHSTDAAANPKTCGFKVTVNACQPPKALRVTASPDVVWPPNHQMVPITFDVTSGNCASVDCRIVSITSSEVPTKRPHGLSSDAWKITGDLTAELRAERSGKGSGRIYTITVQCTDVTGAVTTATVQVPVAHDHSKLSHSLQGHDLSISWDQEDSEAVLESTDDLGRPDWKPVSTGGTNQVTIPAKVGSKFFRLRQ